MLADPLGGWGELTLAVLVFLGSHVVPSRPDIRTLLVAVGGLRAYLVAYSLLSLLVLAWLIQASARAPFVELWPFEEWQRLVPQAGMLAASTLLVFGLTSPNPLSIGPKRGRAFDPARPGIAGFVRHPVLWGAFVWSGAHLVPNGDLAHVILFGMFAVFSVAGMLLLDRRARRRLGVEQWQALSRCTSNIPSPASDAAGGPGSTAPARPSSPSPSRSTCCCCSATPASQASRHSPPRAPPLRLNRSGCSESLICRVIEPEKSLNFP